jgi:serine/threonine-protein kinase
MEKIGAGGMGAVYRARDTRKGRMVALKILPPALAKDKRYLARFIREAQLASKLDHENIVKGYGAGESGGLHYFAMEYVDGENVQQMLAQVGKFPEETALQIVLPIARALQHAHYNGLLHQDVKPENIIIDRRGTAKLLDLGLARRSGDLAKVRLGTPLYVSPEQIQGDRPMDIRSDIYSLGATLFHMLTGRPPYVGRDEQDTMSRHIEDELPWPQDFNPELSDRVCHVVARLLTKDPGQRYQNPKELIYDFESVLDDRNPHYALTTPDSDTAPPVATQPTTQPRRRAPRPQGTGDRAATDEAYASSRSRRGGRKPRQRPPRPNPAAMWLLAATVLILLLAALVIVLVVSG